MKESDISGCTTMHACIEEVFEEHMKELGEEMVLIAILYLI